MSALLWNTALKTKKMKQKIIILRGIPASGKSTYAKKLLTENIGVYKRVNRDELRTMLDNYELNKPNESFIKRLRDHLILEILREGKSVIVDDTNISSKHERRIGDLARQYEKRTGNSVEIEMKEFNVPLEIAIERDSRRIKPVGSKQISKMYNVMHGIHDKKHPIYKEQDQSLPKAIICDLDGTLALMNGRNPFDAARCSEDLPNMPVVDMVKTYSELEYKIILLSGRSAEFKAQTLEWLEKYDIKFDKLVMRAVGDSRKDSIVKEEFYVNHVKDRYQVAFVLDDRDQVVELWREKLRLPCFQVYYGDF